MKALSLLRVGSRRLRRLLLAGVVLLLVYAVLGAVVLPRWLHGLIEREGSAQLGRSLTLERLHVHPFRLQVEISGLRLAEPGEVGPMLAVARIEARLALWDTLYHRAPVLRQLKIEAPSLRLARRVDGRWSFGDLLERFAGAGTETPSAPPPRFALNNIELSDGSIEFDDRPVGLKHLADQLSVRLPFVSSVPSHVEILVEPFIGARLNGTVLALKGQVRPFADRREVSLSLDLDPFDLTRYLAYLPADLPVQITEAWLSTQLQCVWVEAAQGGNRLVLRGEAALSEVRLKKRGEEADWLGWRRLQVELREVQPLAAPMALALGKVVWFEPSLALRRLADGSLDWPHSTQQSAPRATEAASSSAASASAVPRLSVEQLQVQRGRLRWRDDALSTPFSAELSPFDLELRDFDIRAPGRVAGLKASVRADRSGSLSVEGKVWPASGALDLQLGLEGLSLDAWRPYYASALGEARPSAQLAAASRLLWPGSATDKGGLRLAEGSVRLSDLRLPEPGERQPVLQARELRADGIALDLDRRLLELGSLASRDARWHLVRDARGFNLMRLLGRAQAEAEAVAEAGAANAAAKGAATTPGWTLRSGKLDLAAWGLDYEDRSGAEPVLVRVDNLGLRAEGLSNEQGVSGRASLSAVINRRGRLQVSGPLGLSPLQGRLQVNLQDIDLLFTQPWISQYADVLLTRGELDARGQMDFALPAEQTPRFAWSGALAVRALHTLDQRNDSDFLRWKRVALDGLDFSTQPPALSVERAALEDFHSRLILDARGRLNLREIVSKGEQPEGKEAASAPAPDSGQSPAMKLRLGEVLVSGASVDFSDRFIKPDFDLRLSALSGSLRGLSSDADSIAELSLDGRVDQVAPIRIAGQLNPLRQDRFLDLRAKVSDIDLVSASPYSGRYVGYGISRGKLSMDVDYKVRERVLTANNVLRLDQLTFGERVDSPDATSLPVQLAVALLKDRNGVIEVDLPVSGTLDDPQFSVGGVLLKVLVNLVTRAVQSPFALLGSVFGGGDELSRVDFEAGSAALGAQATERLTRLARALSERPALRLDVRGHAAAGDIEGLRRERLLAQLRAAKLAALLRRGESVGARDELVIGPEERAGWLEQVYREAAIPKPANALGLPRQLPPDEMERRLLEAISITPGDLAALAARRARVVRDWLTGEGQVSPGRVFLLEAPAGEGEAAPRVDFALR